ncbi:UbiD family decarboxylase [Burkholderia sp. FERM BP-3421]|jgi:4-hydroxy-3-polyprenylbenzoate decarboxylase|uniref:UbiD family decarboxylase n=1 Tax=Burkholderia sp. FERM BP-3421 TaxID=1494466 RepID=UPI002361186A|nr:UbiD family decarboxylase [Burkholderia sp. FERM BP-3421]WDD95459.1 UbiD family decarboxylase [Burkholderia sp. FERM BP-3421]
MPIRHWSPPHSLRDALDAWRARDALVEMDAGLDPHLEIAAHYRTHFAVSPGSPRSGDEPVVLYTGANGRMPVAMGCFGSRARNEWLLGASPGSGARHLALKLGARIAPRWCAAPPCREEQAPAGLDALPILTTTADDAGPYLTAGIVCAGDPDRGFASVSIHRMRVLDATRLTIWILPGRDLDQLYRKALDQRRPLPISINIGAPPAVYLASCLSAPFVEPGRGELETAGALLGKPIDIARCATNETFCLAQSEIVIEGMLLADTADERAHAAARGAMPEFLGYMGDAHAALPVIEVSAVFHRRSPIYQAFLGPGKEQSELLALPTEAGMIRYFAQRPGADLAVLDVHYLSAGGGQLIAVLRVRKHRDTDGAMARLRDEVIARHRLVKAIWVVDEDIDIHSPEDLFWAMATRFQPSRDLHLQAAVPGFPLDPSQGIGYLDAAACRTDKYLLDLTAPLALRQRFQRI